MRLFRPGGGKEKENLEGHGKRRIGGGEQGKGAALLDDLPVVFEDLFRLVAVHHVQKTLPIADAEV